MNWADAQMKQGDGFIADFSQLSFPKNPRRNKISQEWYNTVVKLLMTLLPIQEGIVHHNSAVKGLTLCLKVLYKLLYFLK